MYAPPTAPPTHSCQEEGGRAKKRTKQIKQWDIKPEIANMVLNKSTLNL